jgi:general secretion pathway protein A
VNHKMLALYGLKWNPFTPNVPTEALHVTTRLESFCWRVQQLAGDGGFALVTGVPGCGKSAALRILTASLATQRDVTVGVISRPQANIADFYREMGDLAARRATPVHVQVCHHPLRHELLAHEVLRQPNSVAPGKLPREGKLDLAGKLRVLAFLARLDLVPQRRPVQQTSRRTIGKENLRVHHAGLVGEVVRPAEPLVLQLLGCSIGCRRDRAVIMRPACRGCA